MAFGKLGLTWTEKSVEYEYILQGSAKSFFQTAWPLDGNEEKLGDTLFRTDFLYYIVEFKRSFEDFPREYYKFATDGKDFHLGRARYIEAKEQLCTRGNTFHFMICGDVSEKDGEPEFVLRCYRYFECAFARPATQPFDFLGTGWEEIKEYLEEYAKWKQGELIEFFNDEGEGDDDSESGRGKAKSLLVGVSADKTAFQAWDLKEAMRLVVRPSPRNVFSNGPA